MTSSLLKIQLQLSLKQTNQCETSDISIDDGTEAIPHETPKVQKGRKEASWILV